MRNKLYAFVGSVENDVKINSWPASDAFGENIACASAMRNATLFIFFCIHSRHCIYSRAARIFSALGDQPSQTKHQQEK